jgi:hypothetical protein
MDWMKERDLLIAQTMSFVQSITGKKPAAETRPAETRFTFAPAEPIERAEPLEQPFAFAPAEAAPFEALAVQVQPAQFLSAQALPAEARPVEVAPTPALRPSPVLRSGVREEIQSRVAAFRAHQQLFDRDRDRYYNSVLDKVRASVPRGPEAPGR